MPPLPFDDDQAPLYTVGQVADMLGVQPAFLRRLDLEEVVQPARSGGGQRRYSRSEIARVQQVSTLAGEGLTLASIRRILGLEAEVADLKQQLDEQGTGKRPSPDATLNGRSIETTQSHTRRCDQTMRTSSTYDSVEQPAGVRVVHQDGTAIVMLHGDIDISLRHDLQAALVEAMEAKRVTVDLSRATFIDSTTLNALIGAHRTAHMADVTMMLTPGPENVMRTLHVSGVDQLIAEGGRNVEDLPQER